jgi:thermolysin
LSALLFQLPLLMAGPIAGQSTRRELIFAAMATDALPAAAARVDALLGSGDLDLASIDTDTMIEGRVHERLVQRYKGLPVFGGALVRQVESGRPLSIVGKYFDGILLDTTPAIDAATAAARAVAAHGGPEAAGAADAVLGVLPTARGDYALAWRMRVRTGRDVRVVTVNALTGTIELDRSSFRDQLPDIGTGTGVFGDRKKIATTRDSQGFQATDHARPASLSAYHFGGSINLLESFLQTGSLFESDRAVDADNVWTDGAVVDGHVYQGWMYDYYFKQFGRHGMDDHDSPISVIVHPVGRADLGSIDPQMTGLFVNNSIYLGNRQIMLGDGDGVEFDYFAGALDVVAHEWSHGVTDYSSALDYVDESGALNEAFSDIMGASAEFFFQPAGSGQRQADWSIGEDITKVAPGFIRSMNNPIAGGQPDHYSLLRYVGTDVDNGGVHYNATIVDHAYYLAVNGGTNRVSGIQVQGVGLSNIDRIEKIFYRGFVLFLGPQATFADARRATSQAASELYGSDSNERAQVEQAWTAVGVN